MELTEKQKEFLGAQFPTPKGGVLTVIGVAGKVRRVAQFTCSCSLCSTEDGVWCNGSIVSSKGNLKKGDRSLVGVLRVLSTQRYSGLSW